MLEYLSPAAAVYALALLFVLGACMGSFLNCFAWRFVRGESVLRGRSHCATCAHELHALDLLPVLGYLLRKGKCHYCREAISPRYVFIELLMGVSFAAVFWRYDFTLLTLRYLVLLCLLLPACLIDWETQELPDRFALLGIALFLALAPFGEEGIGAALLLGLRNGLSISLPLLLLVLLADKILGRESMGGGDIKLIFMIGLHFHWSLNLLHIIVSCVLGLLFAYGSQRAQKDEAVPFGPAIGAATIPVMLFGERLVTWYLSLF